MANSKTPWSWSTSATANGAADGAVNYAEGELPGAVNDAGRGVMAGIRAFLNDTFVSNTTAGTSTAYTVTTSQSLDSYPDGLVLAIKMHATCGANPTLNVNAIGAKDLKRYEGGAVAAGDLVSGNSYWVRYRTGTDNFRLMTAGASAVNAVSLDAGTAGSPSLSFGTDPDTGLYSVGANQLGVSLSGTLRVTFDTTDITSTVPFYGPAGAVATPTYTFTGDANTGVWHPAADTWAVSTNGNEAFRVDASQNVLYNKTASNIATAGIELRNDHSSWFTVDSNTVITMNRTGSNGKIVSLQNDGVEIGSITMLDPTTIQYATTSDEKLKEDIAPFDPRAIAEKINVFSFKWKGSGIQDVGFVAQDLYKIIPRAVCVPENPGGTWMVSEARVTPYALAIARAALEDVRALTERVASLEAQLAKNEEA